MAPACNICEAQDKQSDPAFFLNQSHNQKAPNAVSMLIGICRVVSVPRPVKCVFLRILYLQINQPSSLRPHHTQLGTNKFLFLNVRRKRVLLIPSWMPLRRSTPSLDGVFPVAAQVADKGTRILQGKRFELLFFILLERPA